MWITAIDMVKTRGTTTSQLITINKLHRQSTASDESLFRCQKLHSILTKTDKKEIKNILKPSN